MRNDVVFLRETTELRDEPWPERRGPYLLLESRRVRSWHVRVVVVALALLAAFLTGYTYGVVATRRAVAIERETTSP